MNAAPLEADNEELWRAMQLDAGELAQKQEAESANAHADPTVPQLPAYAAVDPELAAQASPWLDLYIAFSRLWSPQSYDGFHEAIALWLLAVIAARRVVLHYGGEQYTNLMIALCARTTVYAKSTAAGIGRQVLEALGLIFLLLADDLTPQALLRSLSARVPDNYAHADETRRAIILQRLAFVAQRGWFYDEFGQKIDAMMQNNGSMADFRGHLRRFDDCPCTYENETIGRGSDYIERPYLALLASLTPADLRRHARSGSALWGDGSFARLAFITPPADLRMELQDFPDGERIIPASILEPLRAWHERLGVPDVALRERTNERGEGTGVFDALIEPHEPEQCTFGDGVKEAVSAYRRALFELLLQAGENTDLDGNYARLPIKALRIAMLLASLENNARIELRHWARAQQITERWRADLHHLVAQLTGTEPARASAVKGAATKIADWLMMRSSWHTAREVAQQIRGVSSQEAQQHLEAMASLGKAEKRQSLSGRTLEYRSLHT